MIKKVRMIGKPLLREVCELISDKDDLIKIVTDLKDTLIHLQENKKIGRALAAPQIGYKKRVIYSNLEDRQIIMVNPQIVDRSRDMIEIWDSCYSFDVSFFIKIKRHKTIRVEYENERGEKIVEVFEDNLSELFQHEIDHLNGKLATDYIEDNKLIMMRSEWEKRCKNL